jgi:hypothetical protein
LSVSGSTTPAGTLAGVVIKTFSGARLIPTGRTPERVARISITDPDGDITRSGNAAKSIAAERIQPTIGPSSASEGRRSTS